MTTRSVLKKQARKVGAHHLLKCSMMPGRSSVKRKPLSELYVNGKFTGRQRRMAKGSADHDETREVQAKRIEYFKREGTSTSRMTEEAQRLRLAW